MEISLTFQHESEYMNFVAPLLRSLRSGREGREKICQDVKRFVNFRCYCYHTFQLIEFCFSAPVDVEASASDEVFGKRLSAKKVTV